MRRPCVMSHMVTLVKLPILRTHHTSPHVVALRACRCRTRPQHSTVTVCILERTGSIDVAAHHPVQASRNHVGLPRKTCLPLKLQAQPGSSVQAAVHPPGLSLVQGLGDSATSSTSCTRSTGERLNTRCSTRLLSCEWLARWLAHNITPEPMSDS